MKAVYKYFNIFEGFFYISNSVPRKVRSLGLKFKHSMSDLALPNKRGSALKSVTFLKNTISFDFLTTDPDMLTE
jgi:hypothetical protein